MCTVSWLLEQNSYQVLCNRDEKRTRMRAMPPSITLEAELSVLAPRDPQGGGTWIAANSQGTTLAILNGNLGAARTLKPISRGLLPQRLIRLGSMERILTELERTDLAQFLPFTLLVLNPELPVHKVEWDGELRTLSVESSASGFVTSSSFEPEAVRHSREALFEQMRASRGATTPDLLYKFHESHALQPGAYSPCMHRADAETVSFSWIRVSPSKVSLFYTPGAPCQWLPGNSLEAARAC